MLSMDLKDPKKASCFTVEFKCAKTTPAAKGILELHFTEICDKSLKKDSDLSCTLSCVCVCV
jgi:hypothetical protein